MAAHRILFPFASLYGAAAVPLAVASMLGTMPPVPGLATPAGHAHEMAFGFALAVVAGNQLGPVRRSTLALVAGLWLLARGTFLVAPTSLAAALAGGAFAALVAGQLASRVTARVRKWRNRALPVAVVSLCAAAVAMEAATHLGAHAAQGIVLLEAVMLLAFLMFFMGGRIIAPAAAGQAWREGSDLAARVQPRIEGFLVVAMLAALVALPLGAVRGAGAGCVLAAVAGAVRLARWRPWRWPPRRDLFGLATGYAWLIAGVAALGGALMAQARPVAAIHVITVGAMGTLTVQVMALTWARLARRDPATLVLPAIAIGSIAVAALARLAAAIDPSSAAPALWIAAAGWSAAYLLLLASFAAMPRRAGRPGT